MSMSDNARSSSSNNNVALPGSSSIAVAYQLCSKWWFIRLHGVHTCRCWTHCTDTRTSRLGAFTFMHITSMQRKIAATTLSSSSSGSGRTRWQISGHIQFDLYFKNLNLVHPVISTMSLHYSPWWALSYPQYHCTTHLDEHCHILNVIAPLTLMSTVISSMSLHYSPWWAPSYPQCRCHPTCQTVSAAAVGHS